MTQPAAGAKLMNIGEVHQTLREEFPNLLLSKLRYFEAEGLVEPQRTQAGYRKYSLDDVSRLRYALRMQRDHHQPLKVIKERLDALDRGLEPPALPGEPSVPLRELTPDGLPGPRSFEADSSTLRLTRRELLIAAEISDDLLTALESFGLVAPRPGSAPYDKDAVLVARTVAELSAFGIEPRHLRPFKTAADREIGLVEAVTTPIRRSREDGATGRADDVAGQIAALSVRLHTLLVKAGLSRLY